MIETIIDKELNKRHGAISVNRIEQAEGFEIYTFRNKNQEEIQLGDEADFLNLFADIAANIYTKDPERFSSFLVATDIGGKRLYRIEYSDENCLQYKWSTVFLRQFQMTLRPDQLAGSLGFFAEVSLVNALDEKFDKEAPKVARILKDENKQAWQKIMNAKTNFLKTDLYVFQFEKLYSWGFQPVLANGELGSEKFLVRPEPIPPRGAVRRERNNTSGRRIRNRLANARSKAGYY